DLYLNLRIEWLVGEEVINKKYFPSGKNFFVLLIVSLSLVVGISGYLFLQSAFSASSPNMNLFNSSGTIHIVNETTLIAGGTVNVSSLPPVNASDNEIFVAPFITSDIKRLEEF